MRPVLLLALLAVVAAPASRVGRNALAGEPEEEEGADPPQVAIGERLFLETRFAQYFFVQSGGNVNAVLAAGDPALDVTATRGDPLPGPFAGQSMNCRACHLVDEHAERLGAGIRSYADFARRSPVPARADGQTTTVRNAPSLVNASLARRGPFFLHFDAEFPTGPDLVRGTLTGRNFGWLPHEREQAVAHIASVVRGDDGSGALAREFGGAYRVVLAGTSPGIPPELRLPARLRIDVARATDDEILDRVAQLIDAYVAQLEFEHASPYDAFLLENGLPAEPRRFESVRRYNRRLRALLRRRPDPEFVSADDGEFATHARAFVFGQDALEGMRVFFGRGRCAGCHPAPDFTDFAFHNTGATQEEYDAVHGAGSFAALAVPDLAARTADPEAYLPATPAHPNAHEPFRARPSAARPGEADLGLWNVFANPDFPGRRRQRRIARLLCRARGSAPGCARRVEPAALLDGAVALFKTPGLRDLGHSAPYFHTGRFDTLEDVVAFYVDVSARARAGAVRNAAPELRRMRLDAADVAPLAAFLRALDEDYE